MPKTSSVRRRKQAAGSRASAMSVAAEPSAVVAAAPTLSTHIEPAPFDSEPAAQREREACSYDKVARWR